MPSAMRISRKESTSSGFGIVYGNAGSGIPGNQIDLRGKPGAPHEARDFAGVAALVGDAAEQHILERDALAGPELHAADRIDHRFDGPFAVHRHDLAANGVVGRIETDGKLGPNLGRFNREAFNAGDDAGSRDSHALRTEAHFLTSSRTAAMKLS